MNTKLIVLFFLQLYAASAQSPPPVCEAMLGYYTDNTCQRLNSTAFTAFTTVSHAEVLKPCNPIDAANQASTQSTKNLSFTPVSEEYGCKDGMTTTYYDGANCTGQSQRIVDTPFGQCQGQLGPQFAYY